MGTPAVLNRFPSLVTAPRPSPVPLGQPLLGALESAQVDEAPEYLGELAGYQWDSRGWLLRAIPYTDPELLHPEDLVWPVGINNLRVQYTAGYATIPESIQEACAKWVAGLYYECTRDPLLANQLTAAGAASAWQGVPADMTALLAPYHGELGTQEG